MEKRLEIKTKEEGVFKEESNKRFDPKYALGEEYLDSLKCRCSCAPSPGPYCGKARQH